MAFALPGESLSKYGGQSAARTPAQPVESRVPQPKANVVLTKPSTLIETPIEWNGDGLLPGESISRYRGASSETPVYSHSEVVAPVAEPALQAEPEAAEAIPVTAHEPPLLHEAGSYEEVTAQEPPAPEAEAAEETKEKEVLASLADEPLAAAEFEPEEASASYRVDPSAPSEFRFAAPFSVVEEEELVVEVEESLRSDRGRRIRAGACRLAA